MNILPVIITFLLALPAGILFQHLHIPIPWMLGPLTAALVYNTISQRQVRCPVVIRDLGLIVMGYSMGQTVTLETTAQIVSDLPEMFTVTVLTLLFSWGMGYVIHRRTGVSLASAMLGSIPGGLSQMVLLSEEVKHADLAVVTFMQTVRLLGVVFIVPFAAMYGMSPGSGGAALPLHTADKIALLAALPAVAMAPLGAGIAWLTRLPTPFLLGPILGTAAAVMCGYPAPPVAPALLDASPDHPGRLPGQQHVPRCPEAVGQDLPLRLGQHRRTRILHFLALHRPDGLRSGNTPDRFPGHGAGAAWPRWARWPSSCTPTLPRSSRSSSSASCPFCWWFRPS